MRKIVLTLCFLPQFYNLIYPRAPSELFDKDRMEYSGNRTEQAELLLRKVGKWGIIEEKKNELDDDFISLLESDIPFTKEQLRGFLKEKEIAEQEAGGNIDSAISKTSQNITVRYFVIHDTSYPVFRNIFPDNIDSSSWIFNNAERWVAKKTHVYVTRTGKSNTVTDFSEELQATKFEKRIGNNSRGLFLHIELVQPRIYNLNARPKETASNAPTAPEEGFTDAQYEKLALLYICASTRKGEWLVPALHADVDEGIVNAHDDPQNFNVEKFTRQVLQLVYQIQQDE